MIQWPLLTVYEYILITAPVTFFFYIDVVLTLSIHIRDDSHQINQCEYEFENANYGVTHTYGINWKWNNWYHFHLYFNYHLMYFQQIQLGSMKYQLSPWLKTYTSFNGLSYHIIQMAINYIEIILFASKLHVFNSSHILSTFNRWCKIQWCENEYLVKLIQ